MALLMTDVATGKEAFRNNRAMLKPISALEVWGEPADGPGMVATGDEDGVVKVWDMRQAKEVYTLHDNEDYICDLSYHAGRRELLASGGDGYLSVFNMRRGKLEARSDNMDDELLSVCWFRGGKNAICGTQEGVLNIWTAGDWGNISTRFPGHPESIDTICPLDEDTVVTGSSDGILRIVSLLPNRLLGLVGEHGEFPIEEIQMSFNKSLLGSCSHDNSVKFWNIDYLFEEDDEGDEQDGGEMDLGEDDLVADNRGKHTARPGEEVLSKNKQKKKEFFSGLE